VGAGRFLIRYSNDHEKQIHRQLKKFSDNFSQKIIPSIKKQVKFKVAITEMYPWISWELVAANHTSGTTGLNIT